MRDSKPIGEPRPYRLDETPSLRDDRVGDPLVPGSDTVSLIDQMQPAPARLADEVKNAGPELRVPTLATTQLPTRVGPILNTAPQRGLFMHQLVRDIAQPFFGAVMDIYSSNVGVHSAGYQGPRSGFGGDTSVTWLRDYAPIFTRLPSGEMKALTTLSINPVRSNVSGADSSPVAGPSPTHRYFRPPGPTLRPGFWAEVETLPLLLEQGNVVATESHVFLTSKVLSDNHEPHKEPHLGQAGYRARTPDEVVRTLSESLLVPRSQIVIVPQMPGERTRHADMFLLPLGPNEIAVPEIRSEALEVLGYPHERELGARVRIFLDEQAERIRGLGVKVQRLPMLAPVYLDAHGAGNFFSPANSLLIDLGGKKTAFLPTFSAEGFPPAYRALNAKYIEENLRVFQRAGYTPLAVDATQTGRANGLFHCLTSSLPQ